MIVSSFSAGMTRACATVCLALMACLILMAWLFLTA